MNEDQVLQAAIQWFTAGGSRLIYQTRPLSEGAIGGADAILISEHTNRYTFIDAKGKYAKSPARSNAFSNSLGTILKRIRFERGYSGLEDARRFTSPEARAAMNADARHRVSDYVLALTPDFEETVRTALDPALASLLHIRVLLVAPEVIREFTWPNPK